MIDGKVGFPHHQEQAPAKAPVDKGPFTGPGDPGALLKV